MDHKSSQVDDENNHDGTDAASTFTCPQKHPRSSPTCLTLGQCHKRAPLRELAASPSNSMQQLEPRRLSYQSGNNLSVREKWTTAETSALIEFVLFHTTGDRWSTHKQMFFFGIMLGNMCRQDQQVISSEVVCACR